jgi:outer membrane receptor protein involved in Fe transport
MRNSSYRVLLCASVSVLVGLPGLAQAQTAPPVTAAASADQAQGNSSTSADIVVTGSRIARNGQQEPTPVTVVSAQEINRTLTPTVSDYLSTLPQFGTSTSPTRSPTLGVSGGGATNLNLRDLGTTRTLVLIDGRRSIESGTAGGVDINTIPTSLIQRVDVVTGGASAAWGSDAVAGVVNFVLNDRFTGLKVSAQTGITTYGDNANQKIDVTAGTQLLDGRLRIVAAGQFFNSPEIVRAGSRPWFTPTAVVNNPNYVAGNGQPRQITVSGVGLLNNTTGGVIVSGVLNNTQFVGPNGTPAPFNPGYASGILQVGGDWQNPTGYSLNLTNALTYKTAYGRIGYDLGSKTELYVVGMYGNSVAKTDSLYYYRSNALTISANNAYFSTLYPALRQQVLDAGQSSFTYNVIAANGPPPGSRNERTMWQAEAGLDGTLGRFKWNAYYERGQVTVLTQTYNNPLTARFTQAADAVVDPTSGQIVCASASARAAGCVPYNVFGQGQASAAAQAWIFGTVPFQRTVLTQNVADIDISGPVLKLPAGDLSIAVGADYYDKSASSTQDALSLAKAYFTGNFQPFSGSLNVKEAFGEISIPVLKDVPLFRALEINGAARVTDYSASGSVVTWKAGLSDQITSELRLRATRSRDIRAPNLSELYTTGATGTQGITDPVTGRSYLFLANTRGNPALKPEKADTWTAGLIYRPGWLPGLSLSADYYYINVNGAITAITAQQTLLQCLAGVTSFCSRIYRDSTNTITQIDVVPSNINSLKVSGVDLEADYRHQLGPGTISARAFVSYFGQYDQTDINGTTLHLAGGVGDFDASEPKWKGQFSLSYDTAKVSTTARVRYIGGAKLDNAWVQGVDVDNNSVPATAYLDLEASTTVGVGSKLVKLTLAADNVLNTNPVLVPEVPNTVPYQVSAPSTRDDIYDTLGTTIRFGVELNF